MEHQLKYDHFPLQWSVVPGTRDPASSEEHLSVVVLSTKTNTSVPTVWVSIPFFFWLHDSQEGYSLERQSFIPPPPPPPPAHFLPLHSLQEEEFVFPLQSLLLSKKK